MGGPLAAGDGAQEQGRQDADEARQAEEEADLIDWLIRLNGSFE